MRISARNLTSILGALAFALVARGEPAALQPLAFHPDWFSGSQFAGVYVALEHGDYRDDGIALAIDPFAFGKPTIETMAQQPEVPALGTMEGYVFLQKRAAGADLVALAAVLRQSPAGLISLARTPVRTAADFAGRTIGVHRYADQLVRGFARHAGVADDAWTMQFVDDDLGRLERGEVAAMQGYAIEELVHARRRFGEAVRFVSFQELGFDSYGQIVFTTRAQFDRHQELFERFITATRRGWERTASDPDAAVATVLPRMPAGTDRTLVHEMLDAVVPFITGASSPPLMPIDPEKLAHMQQVCVEAGLLSRVEPAAAIIAPRAIDSSATTDYSPSPP